MRVPVAAHSYVHFQPASAPPFLTGVAGTGTGQYLTDQYGQPYLVRGDSIWGLITNAGINGGATTWQSDIDWYMTTRAAQGFNSAVVDAMTTIAEGLTVSHADGTTWDDVAVWSGGMGTMNPAYWQRVDRAVTAAQSAGITVFLVLADTHCLNTTGGPLNGISTGQATAYGTALATRYAAAPNIVWMFGNDYGGDYDGIYDALLAALRAGGDTHLVIIENLSESDSRFAYYTDGVFSWGTDNADINGAYTYGGAYPGIEYSYAEASPLPVLLADGWYDGTGFSTSPPADRDFMRLLTWWSLSSGSRGYIYGDQSLISWAAGQSSRLTSIPFTATDLAAIWNAVEALPGWHQLVPDASGVLVTGHRGTHLGLYPAGTADAYTGLANGLGGARNYYVTASITADKTLAVLYLPDATGSQNGGPVTINESQLVAGYAATWVDPASGAQIAGTPGSSYSRSAANSQGGADWVLVLHG